MTGLQIESFREEVNHSVRVSGTKMKGEHI